MNTSMLRSVAAVLLLGTLGAGCASEASGATEGTPAVESADDALMSEAQILRAFKMAVAGIQTGGGESDPGPFKVVVVTPIAGDTMAFASIARRVGPAIPEIQMSCDGLGVEDGCFGGHPTFGFQAGSSMGAYWAENTKPPLASDFVGDAVGLRAAQRQTRQYGVLRTLVGRHLRTAVNLTVGVQRYESIENGAVAQVLVGKLPSGKMLLIYGIDVWT